MLTITECYTRLRDQVIVWFRMCRKKIHFSCTHVWAKFVTRMGSAEWYPGNTVLRSSSRITQRGGADWLSSLLINCSADRGNVRDCCVVTIARKHDPKRTSVAASIVDMTRMARRINRIPIYLHSLSVSACAKFFYFFLFYVASAGKCSPTFGRTILHLPSGSDSPRGVDYCLWAVLSWRWRLYCPYETSYLPVVTA
jgi:hypothetical protein